MMPTPDRLQALLDRAREANEVETNRVSLETLLAGLHEKNEDLNEAQLKQIQLTIYETLLGLSNTSSYILVLDEYLTKRDTANPISQSAQTIVTTASRAIQTDTATKSLWDLLPKARNEAYDSGFDAGKDAGYTQGINEGNSTGMTEGLVVGFEKGRAEGLKIGLEQGNAAEMQRGIEMGQRLGYAAGLIEGMTRTMEEMDTLGEEDTSRRMPQQKTTRETIVVKLPPRSPVTIAKKKEEEEPAPKLKPKPMSNGVDPFASLLGLVRKK